MPYAAVYTREPSQPSGGPLPGTCRLHAAILNEFGGTNLGIYNPRDVCGNQWPDWQCKGSQHARGAAADTGYPPVHPNGHPDGTRLADWLVTHHLDLGIQEVIWAGRRWTNQTGGWRPYTGRSDHFDHVHLAQHTDAAVRLTDDEIQAVLNPPAPEPPVKEPAMCGWHVTDKNRFYAQMPDGLVRLTDEEAFELGAAGVPFYKISNRLYEKLKNGPRVASFNDNPAIET